MMVVLTIVMIVFCELTPKIFAAVHAEGVALGSAYIYLVLLWICTPVVWVSNHLAQGFLRLVGVTRRTHAARRFPPMSCARLSPRPARWCRSGIARCCCRFSTSSASASMTS